MNFVRCFGKLAAVAAVMSAVPAFAADLPVYEPPVAVSIPAAVPQKLWQGFSLGLLGTYGFSKGNIPSNFDMKGAMFGGGVAGIHGQMGNWVLGTEFDGVFGSIGGRWSSKKKGGAITEDQSEAGAGTDSFKASIDEFYSFRGRVGYALDNFLLYGTGGIGVAHVKVKGENLVRAGFSGRTYGLAPVVGGGVEYKFTDSLSLRAEYLYALPFNVSPASGNKAALASFDGTHMIRAGIAYHLPIN